MLCRPNITHVGAQEHTTMFCDVTFYFNLLDTACWLSVGKLVSLVTKSLIMFSYWLKYYINFKKEEKNHR